MARRTARLATRGRERNLVWSAALVNIDVTTGATPLQQIIASATDWTGALGYKRATILSIRGWLMARPFVDNAVQSFESRALIVKTDVDDDVADLNPATLGTYVNEDILWTGGWTARGELDQPLGGTHFDIAVKSKRKMSVADNVRFVVSEAASANGVTWFGTLRTLIKVD